MEKYNGIIKNDIVVFVDGPDGNSLLGSLDIAFLFPYAIGMFVRSVRIVHRVRSIFQIINYTSIIQNLYYYAFI